MPHQINMKSLVMGISTASLQASCASDSHASNQVPYGIPGKIVPFVLTGGLPFLNTHCPSSSTRCWRQGVESLYPYTNYFVSFIDMDVSAGLYLKNVTCGAACYSSSVHISLVSWKPTIGY